MWAGDGRIITIIMPAILIRIRTIQSFNTAPLPWLRPALISIAMIRRATIPTFNIATAAGSLSPRHHHLHGQQAPMLWTAYHRTRVPDDRLAIGMI
jgi:hypothetical protein